MSTTPPTDNTTNNTKPTLQHVQELKKELVEAQSEIVSLHEQLQGLAQTFMEDSMFGHFSLNDHLPLPHCISTRVDSIPSFSSPRPFQSLICCFLAQKLMAQLAQIRAAELTNANQRSTQTELTTTTTSDTNPDEQPSSP